MTEGTPTSGARSEFVAEKRARVAELTEFARWLTERTDELACMLETLDQQTERFVEEVADDPTHESDLFWELFGALIDQIGAGDVFSMLHRDAGGKQEAGRTEETRRRLSSAADHVATIAELHPAELWSDWWAVASAGRS